MLDQVIDSRSRDLGGGFVVGRLLPSAMRRMVGPFVFFDHMGPMRIAPGQNVDVRPHPHIGLSTVTYLFDGEMLHRDSLGYIQAIRPGEVNWMTAGRGIVHSERMPAQMKAHGGAEHGLQSWVALPVELEEIDPAFAHHPASDLPILESPGVWARLIAGEAYGLTNSVKTHSPTFYLHTELQPGARIALPSGHSERAAFIVSGRVRHEGEGYDAGHMLVFARGGEPVIEAETAARVMLLGGEPLGPRLVWWNLVSSRPDRIDEAKADWKAGRFAMPPDDNVEFIPLPEDPPGAHP